MKSISQLLHKTPWWALLFGGLATFAALAVFVTPYHILEYSGQGRATEESRAIKREVDNAFAENAINVGRGVIRGMLSRTTDPERRAELEEALSGLEEARKELREAGTEALRTKREALQSARQATRAAQEAIRNARRETEKALRRTPVEDVDLRRQLEETLKSALMAEEEARKAIADGTNRRIIVGPKGREPLIDVEIDSTKPDLPALPGASVPDLPDPSAALPPLPQATALPPEVATKIRRDVTQDMYRIGIGALLVLVLVPLFVVAVITKFFVGRTKVSQREADEKRREAEYHRMGQQVTEAKLAALQAQVEPHFLYNTLASVQALTEVDPAKAREMTGHLIQYLRNALPKMRESVSTVGQEVELVRAYLSILQMRMGERLTFDIAVPASLASLPFPPLMLPSLVENAIKHGLEPQREGGSVHISADVTEGVLRLTVADTGRGFGETVGAGVGLANMRERLAALYGPAAGLTLVANTPRGVVATVEVPVAGTRSAGPRAAEDETAAAPYMMSPAAGMASAARVESGPRGFWAKTWDALIVIERIWRISLYYLFLGLVVVTGVGAVALFVAVLTGLAPVQFGDDLISGPTGGLVALAGALVGFVVASVAIGMALLVIYGVGFILLGVAVFVALALMVGLSPILAPFILLGLFIWWMSRRKKAKADAAPAYAAPVHAPAAPFAPVPRVDPTMNPGDTPPPIPTTKPGR